MQVTEDGRSKARKSNAPSAATTTATGYIAPRDPEPSSTAPLDRFAGDDYLLNLARAFVNAEQADVAI